ncbi:MAG: hypothetical protein JO366_12920 [Methylobacteriaceae bacterium]|nr:hypothetical protein [Methylobacteriaceae bacterium]
MMGRSALKISFFVVATCTVILAFFVMGEMLLTWLKPGIGNPRLKLQIVASTEGGAPKTIVPKPSPSAPSAPRAAAVAPRAPPPGAAPVPTPQAPAPPAVAAPAPSPATRGTGPFDAIAGAGPSAPPTGSDPVAYAEPLSPRADLSTILPPADPSSSAPPAATAGAPVKEKLASTEPPAVSDPGIAPKPDAAPEPGGAPQRGPRLATFKAFADATVAPNQPGQSLRILQIGDSHTAADFFTGEVRARLQAIYGDGGAGYLVVGRPNPGVRSELLTMAASAGWAYSAIQKSEDASEFHLSGFNAIATKPGETLTLSTEAPISFDSIDIEVKHGPDSGVVELRFDNDQAVRFDLSGDKPEWWFLRATSQRNRVEQLRRLSITTLDAKPVDVSSVAIFNQSYGVSYSAIGFPGATVDIVNRFPDDFFTDDLQRIDPQIVVLAFGTNEGFNDALDVAKYGERYEAAVKRIKTALPNAEIVIVGPPNANRLPGGCRVETAQGICRAPRPQVALASAGESKAGGSCAWQTPPKLDRVREMQKVVARQDHLYYWNWADVMPPDCGATQWANATPRLMQPDHVHFTADGYRIGADKFAEFLLTIIEKLRLADRVVSNN